MIHAQTIALEGWRRSGSSGLLSLRAAHADMLDEVKKRGTLIVGTEAAYFPYEFVKDGKIIGDDPDIIAIMAGVIWI
jgi:polar amino acid transport system substrate-binding protein